MRRSTGLSVLDEVIGGVLLSDNIVWEIGAMKDFLPFVGPYVEKARQSGKPLVYFRSADHPPLISEDLEYPEVHLLDPRQGFEAFLLEVHQVIEQVGKGAYHIFHCLSDLVENWCSDHLLDNFFVLTCPYLFDPQTVTYFPILRNHHSSHTTLPIMESTQIFISVYRNQGDLYIRPTRVLHHYSTTMYMLHA